MSRIGKLPVPIPDAVKATVADGAVHVEGAKGRLSHKLPPGITAKLEEREIREDRQSRKTRVLVFERTSDSREQRALHGLIRSIAANMIAGVTEGFQKKLVIVGVGYGAKLQGKTLDLQIGFGHPVKYTAPEGIQFQVPSATEILVSGADKRLVGEVAAEIRSLRPPEPYKGKGIRYEGEMVRRKAGKAFVATSG